MKKRLLTVLLTVSLLAIGGLCLPAVALSEPADASTQVVGTGKTAKTVDELLGSSSYAEGRVLVRVTDEYAPISVLSDDADGSISSLYSFSSSSVESASGDGDLTTSSTHDSDRIILIESDTLSTRELLESLVGVQGVVSA